MRLPIPTFIAMKEDGRRLIFISQPSACLFSQSTARFAVGGGSGVLGQHINITRATNLEKFNDSLEAYLSWL